MTFSKITNKNTITAFSGLVVSTPVNSLIHKTDKYLQLNAKSAAEHFAKTELTS
jgi:hypothetical protein